MYSGMNTEVKHSTFTIHSSMGDGSNLWMDIEVMGPLKGLAVSFRIVEQKALLDDEKPASKEGEPQ